MILFSMRDELPPTVWVRRECVLWDRGPYHWTAQCIEGRALVALDRAEAEAMPTLRPCKQCAARDRRRAKLADTG